MGHEVAVTGQSRLTRALKLPQQTRVRHSRPANSSGGTTIQVTNVKMIAKQCHSWVRRAVDSILVLRDLWCSTGHAAAFLEKPILAVLKVP